MENVMNVILCTLNIEISIAILLENVSYKNN
jgi:hypothetical protein